MGVEPFFDVARSWSGRWPTRPWQRRPRSRSWNGRSWNGRSCWRRHSGDRIHCALRKPSWPASRRACTNSSLRMSCQPRTLCFLAISASSLTVRVLRFAALFTGYTSVVRLPRDPPPLVAGEPVGAPGFHFPESHFALAPLDPCRHSKPHFLKDTSRQEPSLGPSRQHSLPSLPRCTQVQAGDGMVQTQDRLTRDSRPVYLFPPRGRPPIHSAK